MAPPPPPAAADGENRKHRRRGKRRRTLGNLSKPLHPTPEPAGTDQMADTGVGTNHKSRRRGKRRRDPGEKPPLISKAEEKLLPSPLQPPKSKRRKGDVAASSSTKSSFLDKMRSRLSGGHFRMLNEKLYTCSGFEAFNYFKNDPQLFDLYHAGYTEQMSHWPEQPVNIIIKWLKSHKSSLTVADFGCGNASLARSVKNKVYSFDLVSNDPSVIACDMSHTPLDSSAVDVAVFFLSCLQTPLDSSAVDVAVFCLSLMGTNFPNYLKEASRVLKPCGWLLIAEVRSRLDPNNGGADPDEFIEAVHLLGFNLVSKDFTNKMFVLFYFQKKETTLKVQEIEWPELKPCLYKRR